MIMTNIKGYLIDLDGTVYLGNKAIPEAKDFIEYLQKNHIPFLFVTNNATKTPESVQQLLFDICDINVSPDTVYTSGMATTAYLSQHYPNKSIYVIGEDALTSLISGAGFVLTEENPDIVVVGMDRSVTYDKLSIASIALNNGAAFIGTNPDKKIPTDRGQLPGAGSLIACLETATGIQPTIIGKPEPIIIEEALRKLNLNKDDVVMVGDNYETDILGAINFDMPSLMVLTGNTLEKDIPTLPTQPTYIENNLHDWLSKL